MTSKTGGKIAATLTATVAALALHTAGCETKRAQVAVQTALTAAAEGVQAADEAVYDYGERAEAAAHDQVLAERLADASGHDVDHWMARYAALMTPWTNAVTALRAARAALHLGQGALTIWIETGHLGEDWGAFCSGVDEAFAGLLEALETAGVVLPAAMVTAGQHVETACTVVAAWAAR